MDGLEVAAPLRPGSSRRVVVLGGLGSFGRAVRRCLADLGVPSVAAGRRPGAEVRLDADDEAAICAAMRPGDVVIDTAGPFQKRSLAVLQAALKQRFDVIDLNDDLGYGQRVRALGPQLREAGVRVLSSCSSVSAIGAFVVGRSGFEKPARVTSFLAPSSRHTAHVGSARSLLYSLGQRVTVWRGGAQRQVDGWRESRSFLMPRPLGRLRGLLFQSADAVWLPAAWPSLRCVEMFVDPNLRGLGGLVRQAARRPALRRGVERFLPLGLSGVRWLGRSGGGLGYEIEGEGGEMRRYALWSVGHGVFIPVLPAALAARRLLRGSGFAPGLVPHPLQVEEEELIEWLHKLGIEWVEMAP